MAALVFGACGDDEPRLTKDQFIERGSAICGEVNARIESAAMSAFSEPGKIPTADEVSAFAAETVAPSVQSEVERLEELRPPEDDEDRVEELLEEGYDSVDRVRQDPTVLLSSNDDGFARYRELTAAYGLQKCGGGSQATRDAIEGISP